MVTFDKCKHQIDIAITWLKAQSSTGPKIIAKVSRNLGDSLHFTPIARHYRCKYPECSIAFLTEARYVEVHRYNKDYSTFILPNDLDPQMRIKLGKYIMSLPVDIKLCPAIFPFGEVWDSHKWRVPVIAHQYFHNAGIKLSEMLGDKKLHAPITPDDVAFAESFMKNKKYVAFEYVSYSHTPYWQTRQFSELQNLICGKYTCISFASPKEPLVPKTKDGRGMPWRRTIAILSRCKFFVGIGSGITMLAACAKPQPTIIEVGVSDAISMSGCGYADSKLCSGKTKPADVARIIMG
jgi:ADP-heptose:LPS heptosyltransferase